MYDQSVAEACLVNLSLVASFQVLRHDCEAEQVVNAGHDLGLDPVDVHLEHVARVVEGGVVLIQKVEETFSGNRRPYIWSYLAC